MHQPSPRTRHAGWRAALLAASIAAVLLACGRGEGTAAPSSATPPALPAATSTAAAAAAAASATPSGIATPGGEPIASTAGIARGALPIAEFTNADGYTIRLPVEVPPRSEYSIGLSGRRTLDERGMLFYFAETARGSFWMKDTHIDLSIAFVTTDERIVEIREMRAESTAFVTPNADYRYAIEAPSGWYKKNKVRVDDTARLNFPLPKELQAQ